MDDVRNQAISSPYLVPIQVQLEEVQINFPTNHKDLPQVVMGNSNAIDGRGTYRVSGPLTEDKFEPYNNSNIVCYDKDENPIDARAMYLLLKEKHDDEAHIFQIMDDIYEVATQPQKEDASSPIEESDGPVDLSRILKEPRQKTKGTRQSGRSRPKKKDPNYVY